MLFTVWGGKNIYTYIYIFAPPPSSPNERTLNQKKIKQKNISTKKNQREIIDFMPCIAQISRHVFCGPWWRPFLDLKNHKSISQLLFVRISRDTSAEPRIYCFLQQLVVYCPWRHERHGWPEVPYHQVFNVNRNVMKLLINGIFDGNGCFLGPDSTLFFFKTLDTSFLQSVSIENR